MATERASHFRVYGDGGRKPKRMVSKFIDLFLLPNSVSVARK